MATAVFRSSERRRNDREPVLVPATIEVGGKRYTARLINVTQEGAMIESDAHLTPHLPLKLGCGSFKEGAYVVWSDMRQAGIKFLRPLTCAQVDEQVSRTAAMKKWR